MSDDEAVIPSPNDVKAKPMHPNHTPKKFLDQPVNQAKPLGLLMSALNNREAAWKTIMVPSRMKGDRRGNLTWAGKYRQNSKTATDCYPHSDHYYRSWRSLIDGKKALALALAIEEGT